MVIYDSGDRWFSRIPGDHNTWCPRLEQLLGLAAGEAGSGVRLRRCGDGSWYFGRYDYFADGGLYGDEPLASSGSPDEALARWLLAVARQA